jgi:hypothetical protein
MLFLFLLLLLFLHVYVVLELMLTRELVLSRVVSLFAIHIVSIELRRLQHRKQHLRCNNLDKRDDVHSAILVSI